MSVAIPRRILRQRKLNPDFTAEILLVALSCDHLNQCRASRRPPASPAPEHDPPPAPGPPTGAPRPEVGPVGPEEATSKESSRGPSLQNVEWIEEQTIAELRSAMETSERTAVEITEAYLERIERIDPDLRSIVEVNPDARSIASDLDAERAAGSIRGPLHGIPIVLKENIDTADSMLTTAGSLALVESMPTTDSTTASRLRAAGAVILGKAGMSEWAFFRSSGGSSGWSARNGQVRNPYDPARTTGGSSSGSGASPSANLTAAAIGTETDGSIVSPANANGIVGLKPTVGLTSRAGVIPISGTQDTIGPLARTVADAAAVLTALAGSDPRDQATAAADRQMASDYTAFVGDGGLETARIGLATAFFGKSKKTDAVLRNAIESMTSAGAVIVDVPELAESKQLSDAKMKVLLFEFKVHLAEYLATRTAGSPRTLADIIEFDRINSAVEMIHFDDDLHQLAQATDGLDSDEYLLARRTARRLGAEEGIDRVLDEHDVVAIIAPTGPPAPMIDWVNGEHRILGSSSHAAAAGYPLISVPAGYIAGLPVGITFMGTAWSEPTLLRLSSAFEHARGPRTPPLQR